MRIKTIIKNIIIICIFSFASMSIYAKNFDDYYNLYISKSSKNILDMLLTAYGQMGKEKCLKEIISKYSYDNIDAFLNEDEDKKVKYLSEWMANKSLEHDEEETKRESRVSSIRKEQSEISESIYRNNVTIQEKEKESEKVTKLKTYAKNSINRLIKENIDVKDDICEMLDISWKYFFDDLTYSDLSDFQKNYFDKYYIEECLYEGTKYPFCIVEVANFDFSIAKEIWEETPVKLRNDLRNSYVKKWYALVLKIDVINKRGYVK